MIKFFLIIVFLTVPLVLVYLNIIHPGVEGGLLFSAFIIVAMIFRVWETFYTSKDKDARKFRGDWSLIITSFMYYLISLLIIFAFFATEKKNIILTLLGLVIFIIAAALRLWSTRTLGSQWFIHLTDIAHKNASDDFHVLRTGPYKYIRHPIYLGTIMDLVGISLMANNYYCLLFVFLVNTPLYIWRSIYEEKQNIRKFGDEYAKYKNEVSFLIPWKIFFFKKYGHNRAN